MNIKNVVLKDMVLQADKGLDMTEGTGITLQNVQLITKDINPVMNIHNSQNITLNKIGYSSADLLLNVTGEKSKDIKVMGTDLKTPKKGMEFNYGAKETAVTLKAM